MQSNCVAVVGNDVLSTDLLGRYVQSRRREPICYPGALFILYGYTTTSFKQSAISTYRLCNKSGLETILRAY